MTWHQLIQAWVRWLHAAGRPDTTIRLRRHQITLLAESFPAGPSAPRETDLVDWLASHAWAPETLRSHRAALVTFYRWAYDHGHVSANPAAGLPSIRPVVHPPRPAPETVVDVGLHAADPRVRLMVGLAARAGLRRAEIAKAHTDDLHHDFRGWSLTVHGKGDKPRVVPLQDDLADAIRVLPSGWVFPGPDGHLSADYIGKLIARALPGIWTAHPLRHRFGTKAYAGTRDLLAVQALLGHSRPETTLRYVELPNDALRAAALAAA